MPSFDFGPISVFHTLGLISLTLIGWYWIRTSRGRLDQRADGRLGRPDLLEPRVLLPYAILGGLCLLLWALGSGFDEDETEQWHCAWMVSEGLIPYVDFWQHHQPFSFLVLSPLTRALGVTPQIYVIGRIMASVLSLLTGFLAWRIAQTVWGPRAAGLSFLVTYISACAIWQFAWIRADSFMLLFLLLGVFLTLRAVERGAAGYLWAGLSFGLMLTFSIKQAPMVLLPWLGLRRSSAPGRGHAVFLLLLGFILGFAPLPAYLLKMGILHPFWESVVVQNLGPAVTVAGFPALLAVLAVIGWVLLGRSATLACSPKSFVLRCALVLASLGSCLQIQRSFAYYAATFAVLASIFAAGLKPSLILAENSARGRRQLLLAVALTLLLEPPLAAARDGLHFHLQRDTEAMNRLLTRAGHGSVLMLNPEHPIFVRDATRLYTRWQFRLSREAYPQGEPPDWAKSFRATIIRERPQLISFGMEGRALFGEMLDRGWMTRADHDSLGSFLEQKYTLRWFGARRVYTLRDDSASAGCSAHTQ